MKTNTLFTRLELGAVVRDNDHELATRKYIEINPTKAGLVLDPRTWLWSSARFRDEFGVLKI